MRPRKAGVNNGTVTIRSQLRMTTHPEFWAVRVIWHRHIDFYVVRSAPPFELGLALDHVFHTAPFVVFHRSLDPYKWLHRRR